MEETSDSAVLRRRRRITRTAREKTPEPGLSVRRKYSDEYSESSSTFEPVQMVRMQIRPPGAMSAHESKILRRRDKTFASAAARSHSQPRQAERLSSPEAYQLLRTVEKRSLSSPRHKEESSEGEHYATSPEILENYPGLPTQQPPKENENLSRLEQNLRRFEDERRRFELEKRVFEKEKREHKVRYKKYLDNEERKRLMENYRKLSDRIQLPTDADERRRMVHSLRLSRNEAPVRLKPVKPSGYESSTPLSSSESEAVHFEEPRRHRSPPPVQKYRPPEVAKQPAVPPPPPVPIRKSVSRNNSLSPIRPARRSKTPDTGNDRAQKSSTEDGSLERKRSVNSSVDKNGAQSLERKRSFRDLEEKRHNSSWENAEQQNLERNRSLKGSRVVQEHIQQGADKDIHNGIQQISDKERKSSGAIQEQIQQITDKIEKSRKLSIEKKEALMVVRKRSLPSSVMLKEDVQEVQPQKKPRGPSIISRLIAFLKRLKPPKDDSLPPSEKLITKAFIRQMFSEMRYEWLRLKADYPQELLEMRKIRNKCFSHTIILVLLCGFGGLMFRYTEGSFENIYKCEVRKVKRDFIDYLWTVSHNMREDDWKSAARMRLRKFEEELHAMQELGVRRFPGMKSWNFVNCVLYCWTVITTIGYGHITPQTTLGRSLTVIYSIIGIPMFLILLADFGKLFTRAIKFIWAYVRRMYYTGTCRKVRKQQQVLDVISGFNTMYDYAMRRPSQYIYGNPTDEEAGQPQPEKVAATPQTPLSHMPSHPETPTSPYPETFEVDDEFNLPISLASIILISYIVIGAFVYTLWEDWTYFEAFYFVFISMSTIGFGDFVPNHPIFMMCSIIYLIFGLALTSMFINVVQIKLSDTFKDASAKIGATIGLTMAEGTESHVPTPSDIASVHIPKLDPIGEVSNEEVSPNEVLKPPQPLDFDSVPPPLLPKKTATPVPPEEKPKKKKGFFRK